VKVTSEATGQPVRELTTDESGIFTASLLPVGNYTVEVSATGFAPTKFPGITVVITETTRMLATLKVSSAQQVVEVQSQVAQINTVGCGHGRVRRFGYNYDATACDAKFSANPHVVGRRFLGPE
jgi:hypothetical protein